MPRKRGPKSARAVQVSAHGKRKESSKMVAWNKRSDIPLDDEEQFHSSRDRILLEGDEEGHDSDGDEEEVFALEGLSESEDTDEDLEYEDGDNNSDNADDVEPDKSLPKGTYSKKELVTSARDSDDGSTDNEDESWGKKKSAYYSSNIDQLESDDDEANDMEEEEARRIQAKLRSTLSEADFGLGDLSLEHVVDECETDDPWQEKEGSIQKPFQEVEAHDRVAVLQRLQKSNPEALALALEWDDVVLSVVKTQHKIANLDVDTLDPSVLGMIHLHHQTQLMYASVLAYYLHLRSSEKYAAKPESLRSHPVMRRLLTLKQGLTELEELDFDMSDDSEDEDDDEIDFSDGSSDDENDPWRTLSKNGLDASELADLLNDARSPNSRKETSKDNKKVERVRASKHKQPLSTVKPVYELVEPTFVKSKESASPINTQRGDLYGEVSSLDSADVADKNVRKKALRFHVSKIESASARRQNARSALGGDEDIPYRERRERFEDKTARKNLGAGGDDLDDEDPEPRTNDKKRSREGDDSDAASDADENEDGYYSLVKKQKAEKKAEKKAKYEAAVNATKGLYEEKTVDGQRSVTRAIMKNKGLTPKRAKAVRNPRVKKRLRFEKAKKKVSSQKAVYKGRIGDTDRYGGEESGITKVVKSVKF